MPGGTGSPLRHAAAAGETVLSSGGCRQQQVYAQMRNPTLESEVQSAPVAASRNMAGPTGLDSCFNLPLDVIRGLLDQRRAMHVEALDSKLESVAAAEEFQRP